jgi:hypothetical protein
MRDFEIQPWLSRVATSENLTIEKKRKGQGTLETHVPLVLRIASTQKNVQFQQRLCGKIQQWSRAGRASTSFPIPLNHSARLTRRQIQLITNVWHQRHKSRSLDRLTHRMLTGSWTTWFSARNDSTMSIHQLG